MTIYANIANAPMKKWTSSVEALICDLSLSMLHYQSCQMENATLISIVDPGGLSLNLGAHLKLEPERVYLHAGTADGAKALKLDHRRESLNVDEVPSVFKRLKPREIEDCLCIYKDHLGGLRA